MHGLSASELLQGLKSKGVRSPDVSRALGRRREYVCERGLICVYVEGGCVWWRRVGVVEEGGCV